MELELRSGPLKAIIDPQGAWVTNVSDEKGDVLFPRRKLKAADGTEKVRGGCHVCLPNFGPGGASGQPQHGFGRQQLWEVIDRTDSSALLELNDNDGYAGLYAVLAYQLGENKMVMTLELTNNSNRELRVAPAFHPYFALTEGEVKIDSETQELDELQDTKFIEGDHRELELPNRRISLSSSELPVWALWTDRLGNYVCVEPTRAGYSFLNETPDQRELLGAGETKTYVLTIAW